MPFSENKILWMLLLILHSLGKFSLKMYKLDRKSFLWFFHLHRELDLLNLRLTKHVFVFFHSMRGLGNRFWNSTWKVMVRSTKSHKVLKNKSSNFRVECLFPSSSNVDKNVSRWYTNSCCLFCSVQVRVSCCNLSLDQCWFYLWALVWNTVYLHKCLEGNSNQCL